MFAGAGALVRGPLQGSGLGNVQLCKASQAGDILL